MASASSHPVPARSVLALLLLLAAVPARASTDGPPADWSLSELGGTKADRQMLYDGTPGVLMGSSPAGLLFVAWRRLHGRTIPSDAGESLVVPCCAAAAGTPLSAMYSWLEARKTVPGAPSGDSFIDTERPGPHDTSNPNCLADSFITAVRTLKDRAAAHGAGSPEVRAWLDGQDGVFRACAKPVDALPPLPDAAPDWLRADRRYQSAAVLFYNADYPAAAASFAAIAADQASPWHGIAPYLRLRALLRQGLASSRAEDFAAARAAAAAIPAEAPLHGAAQALGDMAELHADPNAARARLLAILDDPAPGPRAGDAFKDLASLPATDATPEPLDWIATFKTGAAAPPVPPDDKGGPLETARAADARRVTALAHARARYNAGHDPAWLLAALALTQPDDGANAAILADAAALDPGAPAFLTATYHRIRLALAAPDAADTMPATRATLDTLLARTDLTSTTRNLFTAERMLAASDGPDMARSMMRLRFCAAPDAGCNNSAWGYDSIGAALTEKAGDDGDRGLGDDARYLVDRMALAPRLALGRDPSLPKPVQLDLALTSFARAVLLHDEAAVDALCPKLGALLPVMAAEFAAIPAARRGPDRLFAEYLVFAKMPGLRVDLVDYTRPVGVVADFGGHWPNWVVLAAPDADSIPPAPILYDNANEQVVDVPAGTDLGGGHVRIPDVVCKGLCGASGFVPRPMPFLAATAARATAERRFLPPPGRYADPQGNGFDRRDAFPVHGDDTPGRVPAPRGATYVWEFILDYARTHPQDPRVPEALHWLIHVGHYGQGNDHSGRRAFALLKARYPRSEWARQNPFYYD